MALLEKNDISAEEIAGEGLNVLDNKYQKSIGFFAWDYFIAVGKILKNLWDKIFYISDCLTDLSKMTYEDLVNFVWNTRGIQAKTATYSSGELTVETGSGTVKKGDIFETASGIRFCAKTTTDVIEGDKFEVECVDAGHIGNVVANTITIIPTTIQGLVSVKNEKAFDNGYESESKEDLLERYYEDLRQPITSGNIYHYKKWAKEISGVGDAKVKPLWNGDNTVKVVIIDSDRNIPSESLIAEVQEYIDPLSQWGCGMGQAPIGAYCTVAGAVKKSLNIALMVKLNIGVELENIRFEIRKSINNYLQECAFTETYISLAKIGALVIGIDGVKDYMNLTINGNTDNILLIDDDLISEIAILDELEIEVIE